MDTVLSFKSEALACTGATAVAHMLKLPNALQTGLSVCAGVVGYSLLKEDHDNSLTNKQMKEFIKESRAAIVENHETAKQNYSAYREVIRKLIVEHKKENERMIHEKMK
jgi:hypothetical protein